MLILNSQENTTFQSQTLTPMADSASYLDKCQVDTPQNVVVAIWDMLGKLNRSFKTVVDYGAGDCRFSSHGTYDSYTGYEIDAARLPIGNLPANANVKHECALSSTEGQFDLCVGNPPFVRHHDIDKTWYENACKILEKDLGFRLDRRSNAFLLFLAKALLATKHDGVVALVIPFEWVSRPAARGLREFIQENKWEVRAYRFTEDIFHGVMTTASLTIIDKSKKSGKWSYFSIDEKFKVRKQKFVSGDVEIFEYARRTEENFAQRGLSPGGQDIFCLSEGQRIHNQLIKGVDVVPCVTTMRHWEVDVKSLTEHKFQEQYVNTGMKCWLLKTWEEPSSRLMNYLNSISKKDRDNYTCNQRSVWWKVPPHSPPDVIYSSAFVNSAPKFLLNAVGAVAVGTIQGIHNVKKKHQGKLHEVLSKTNFAARVVAHSGKLRKIEVGQMNKIVFDIIQEINSEK